MALKTLANCKPSEFLRQTSLIKKSVEKWLTDTDIINIRKRLPRYETASESATAEERAEVIRRNKDALQTQIRKNLSAIFDAVMDTHPEETLEVLALVCFVDPKDVDNYPMSEYLNALSDLLGDEATINFFTSLARLARTNISKP